MHPINPVESINSTSKAKKATYLTTATVDNKDLPHDAPSVTLRIRPLMTGKVCRSHLFFFFYFLFCRIAPGIVLFCLCCRYLLPVSVVNGFVMRRWKHSFYDSRSRLVPISLNIYLPDVVIYHSQREREARTTQGEPNGPFDLKDLIFCHIRLIHIPLVNGGESCGQKRGGGGCDNRLPLI